MSIEESRARRRGFLNKELNESETSKCLIFFGGAKEWISQEDREAEGLTAIEDAFAGMLKISNVQSEKTDVSNIDLSSVDHGRVLNFGDNFSGLSLSGYIVINDDILSNDFNLDRIMMPYLIEKNYILYIYINDRIFHGYCIGVSLSFITAFVNQVGIMLRFLCTSEETI
jgi:hypothetical protein